jgi:tetratricopeptide (TPR) repeat protein
MTRHLAWFTVIALSVIFAFSSATTAPLVFDDVPAIRENASIRQLAPLSVPLSPPANTSVSGRPIVNLSLAVNYAINTALGVDPTATFGFHVANILIHIACALLLFAIVRRTLVPLWTDERASSIDMIAGFAALLWALHPIQTGAVDYVVQRTELLVSAFYLATLYCSIRAWDAPASRRTMWYVFGVVACMLGLWSKEVMLTAPFVLLVYDRTFRAESWSALFANVGRRNFYIALGVATALAVLSVGANARTESVGFNLGITWYEYAYTQAWAIARYLRLLVLPVGLTFDYGQHAVRGLAGIPGLVVITALLIGAVIAWRRPERRWLAFLAVWFFFILAPSSSIVPIRTEVAAERRVYLASAAVFLLVVVGVDLLARRLDWRSRVTRGLLCVVALLLAVLTFARGRVYADTELLYRDVIAKAPNNARGYVGVGLAMVRSENDRSSEAFAMFRRAVELDSNYFAAWQLLGTMELARQNWPDAAKYYTRALQLEPGNLPATDGLVRSLIGQRQFDAALPHLDRLGDSDVDALWAVSTHLLEQGRGADAVKYLELVAKRAPSAMSVAMLSAAYAQANRIDEATQAARAATSAAGDTASVYVIAGRAMIIARRFDDARTYLQRALTIDPTSEPAKRALDAAMRAKP